MANKHHTSDLSDLLAIQLMRILDQMPEVQKNPEITFDELMENPDVYENLYEATER